MMGEFLGALRGKRQPLRPLHRIVVMSLGFLTLVTGFSLSRALIANKHYIAFWLTLIPALVIFAKGAALMRIATVSPSSKTESNPRPSAP
jgi:hypothetical protein